MSENKRKKLAQLMAAGNGVPDLSSENVPPTELRDYLALLPIGHKISYGGREARVAEVQMRDIKTVPEDLKKYYIHAGKFKKARTFK